MMSGGGWNSRNTWVESPEHVIGIPGGELIDHDSFHPNQGRAKATGGDVGRSHVAGGWPGPPLAACGGRETVNTSTPVIFACSCSRSLVRRKPGKAGRDRPAARDSPLPSCLLAFMVIS